MSSTIQPQPLTKADQALIPQAYMRGLQSKALLNHYEEDHLRKMYNRREDIDSKIRQLQFAKQLNERHLYEQQMKKQFKGHVQNQYSKVYDNMIDERKKKEKDQKQRQLWLEKNLLDGPNWIKGHHEQRQIDNKKKAQYAKQLDKNLRDQEGRRFTEAKMFKEQVMQEEPEGSIPLPKRHAIQAKQLAKLGVKDVMKWSQDIEMEPSDLAKEPLTPRMDRMLKVQQQKHYDKGLSHQYKSQNERKYFEQNPQKPIRSQSSTNPNPYNPILNPIPHYHRNPAVLNIISKYG